MGDNINHPDHYQNIAGIEAIDILDDIVKDLPGKQAAMLWNTLKYLFRFQKKNGVEDLKKAQNYLQRLIDATDTVKTKPKNNSRSNMPKKQAGTPWGMWYSKKYGDIRIYSRSSNLNGMPSKLTFDTESAATEFEVLFYRKIIDGFDKFSIADIALDMGFEVPKSTVWNNIVDWSRTIYNFSREVINGRYALIFNYKDSCSDGAENFKSKDNPDIKYASSLYGTVEVYSSSSMPAGTCDMIKFENGLSRDLFIASFYTKLTNPGYKPYSIRDTLFDCRCVVPYTFDEFGIDVPWRDIIERFRMYEKDEKYILEFVYKDAVMDDGTEIKEY